MLCKLFVCFALVTWVGQGTAQVRFEPLRTDAGVVKTGQKLAQRFRVINAGSEPIEIVEVKASCGCLRPTVDRSNLMAGETANVELVINTLTQSAGPRTWTLDVQYREGSELKKQVLQLTANLVAEVTVQPATMVVFADRAAAHEIVLTDHRAQPLTVSQVRTSSEYVFGRLLPIEKGAHGETIRRIRLEVGKDFPEGRQEIRIDIVTDDRSYGELTLPVTMIKRSPQGVSALPPEVKLTAAPGAPIPSRIVLLRSPYDQPVLVEEITPDDPALRCTWAKGPQNLATLKVQIDRGQLSGPSLHSAVHVHIVKPRKEIVTIPVEFIPSAN